MRDGTNAVARWKHGRAWEDTRTSCRLEGNGMFKKMAMSKFAR